MHQCSSNRCAEMMQVEKRHAVRLYYGTKNESHTAFRASIAEWQEMGVTVKHVYSDEDRGYVQQVFKEVRQILLSQLIPFLIQP